MAEEKPGSAESGSTSGSLFEVRTAREGDAAELCELLNEIIRIGGTTAIEAELDPDAFQRYYISGPDRLSCQVAEARDGVLLGFQFLGRHSELPSDCGDISTFARQRPKVTGVGTALFSATLQIAEQIGLREINATIRSDNTGGLAYYSKVGFVDHSVMPGVPLRSGKPVDRISKRYRIR